MEQKLVAMNVVGSGLRTVTVSIPHEVIKAQALKAGVTPEDFVRLYTAVVSVDGDAVTYTFQLK